MMKQDLSFKIKNAAFDFKDKRGNFYLDLASVMEASPGEPITKILARYAERYKKRSVGVLSRHWLDRFAHVGTFTEAVRGSIPDEDLTALSASESAGDLRLGLEKLGANILAMQETRKEINKLMVSAVVMVLIFHAYLGIQAFVVMPKLEKAVRAARVEFSQLGNVGTILFGSAEIIRGWWWAWLILVVAGVFAASWGLKHYVGKRRRWLDDHFLPFQMARDFNSAAFFATVGMLTTARNNNVMQLHDALLQTRANAYPWLKWQTTKLLENLAGTPNAKGEIFNTGIANESTYYRILDISDHSDVPVMLKKVGEIILKTAPQEIKAKAATVRITLMALCMVTMLGVYVGTISLVELFKAAVSMKAMLH